MSRRRKKAPIVPFNTEGWLATYADMITLLLCFFVIMFNPDDAAMAHLEAAAAAMQVGGIGVMPGGFTVSPGRNADLGNTIMSLPSLDRGRALGTELRRAVSVFAPEIRTNRIRVTQDERGLVISLVGDAFFHTASATIDIEATRDSLLRVGTFLASSELADRDGRLIRFRIEGHTDSVPVDPLGPWTDNWQLSAERAMSILRYLVGLGLDETRFQIAGFAATMPIASNDTPQGRQQNRRVDIIIVNDGHL